ncbi:eIF-2-alpha kinase GCN2 isoform X1 [Cynara cardunculus var. scolymus]|uniref:eIF-2-alpha kinase GCN2 isoform X1 n=1 Tax=Cynara cardunculus var. scolymus TaxID=59895 RepID=UPI000D62EAF7|nr:eIF-2-alpha kinase GCN2 isoform X1 [Cynara cardunculus var. scolymus]
MGHSAKKKKRGGTGRRRAPSSDHTSIHGVGGELLSEELTALSAIFQEDCDVLSESPPRIKIKLRPYSQDSGFEDLDVSALLSIRFLPGYPYKCPKLLIIPEKGLSKSDADNLLSLLHDQANLNAREGRVMIYNLVEAAQEFLSEVVPLEQRHVPCATMDRNSQLSRKNAAVSCDRPSKGPFVYGFTDLFIGSGESWPWGLSVEKSSNTCTSLQLHALDDLQNEKVNPNNKMGVAENGKLDKVLSPTAKLDTLEEESRSTESYTSLSVSEESEENVSIGEDYPLKEDTEETDVGETKDDHSESGSPASMNHHQISHTVERDLILAHLLRLACAPKGPLADALTDVTSELVNLGIVSDRVADLATEPPSVFDRSFNQVFRHRMVASKISHFWRTASDSKGQHTSPTLSSRYLNDFEELQPLGHGGFGHVVLCKNKLDGRQYAVKKIRLKDKNPPLDDRILREVATLSRLQHQHVVRYYQAWFETGDTGSYADAIGGSRTAASSSFSYIDLSSTDVVGQDNKVGTYLYIQMEYCPRTLRQMFESYSHFDKKLAWHLFRQIVEGLAHIHSQGIIHRDLTPNNIFFDARNDIKIGDFGLAKFLKLEQLEQDLDPAETTGVSVDGTGQIGTYFYTAPEIEQRWPKINEKADMYSLGIVFLELWHPFSTGMERHIVLSDLKKKGELPLDWVEEFPEQASLLRHMMSSSPSDRPSATELLQHAFPPRMESELLDNILRTMHNSEDTSIYDKVVNAIFNEETLSTKNHDNNAAVPKLGGNDTSSIHHTDLDTEMHDLVQEISAAVFRLHCAKRLEIIPMRLVGDSLQFNRNAVKLLTNGGDMIELCHELRLPFINWVVLNQKSSFKRFEICYVYRRPIGHSPPNRYLQGDFDVIGGASALTEAEVIKAAMDIITRFFHPESCDIHLNHGDLLEAIWSWIGIKADHRQKVAELLSVLGSLRPQSSERKTKWVVIRRQLRQELNITEGAVNKLQTVGLRFCGIADQALPRLRGALPADILTRKALDELSQLFNYLRTWRIDKHVFIDPLMPPTEGYHRDSFFQIYLRKDNSLGSLTEGTLLAVGGRYDYLLHDMWQSEYKSNPPGAVGTSLALETIIQHSSVDIYRPFRNDSSRSILVCSRGGGGLLEKRMELVAELWEDDIKAQYVPLLDPSLTEQYEYANEHDIKCLVIISDTGVSQKGSVKIRHLELKREKEVSRESLTKFLSEAMASQFRNPSIWN